MRKLSVVALGSVVAWGLVACSSGGGGSSSSPSTESTQAAALTKSITAMSSLGDQSDISFSPIATMAVGAQSTSTICNDDGTPKATGNNTTWAFSKFLCAGAHNTYSPDSALGAISLMKGIICTADSAGATYTSSGASVTLTNVKFSTSCFSQAMIDAFADEGLTTISGTFKGYTMTSTSGWDYRAEFRSTADISDFDIYVRNSDDVIAAAFVGKEAGEDADAWTITIDRRNTLNSLIYEAANKNRHIRIMAEGTITTAGEVTNVEDMAGIIGENGMSEYVALRGNETDGIYVQWQKNGLGAEDTPACEFDADCVGVDDLGFVSTDRAAFAPTDNTAAIADFIDNPIYMTVAAFEEGNLAAAFGSTLR